MRSALVLGLACTLFAVGCGGGSPTSPSMMTSSMPGTPGATAGATITGSVTNASAPRSLPAASRAYAGGLMVQVVGTTISVAVGPNGEFTLQGVPAGDVRLRFTGDGCDATITLTGLQTGETVVIKVTVSGTTAKLDDDSRDNSDHEKVEVNGIVSDLVKTPPTFRFRIGSRVVNGDATTEFFGDGNRGETIADLVEGARVEVKGEMRSGEVFALRIHINPNSSPDPIEIEAEGQIVAKGGSGSNLVLTVRAMNGLEVTVYTSAATTVKRGSQVLTLDALAVGQTIEAEGTAHAGGGLDATKISIEDDDDSDTEMEVEGALSGLANSCPSVSFTVKGVSVFTNAATSYPAGSCASLKNGDSVKVKGTKQPDGRLLALQVKR